MNTISGGCLPSPQLFVLSEASTKRSRVSASQEYLRWMTLRLGSDIWFKSVLSGCYMLYLAPRTHDLALVSVYQGIHKVY